MRNDATRSPLALATTGVRTMFMQVDSKEISGIWSYDEVAVPGDPPGPLKVVEGVPEDGKMQQLKGVPSSFTPDCAPEEFYEIAAKLYKASR
jgi:hypothetical protein